jgi:hypothetical protein
MEKAKSTLKQFVRDWSLEGAEERALCYEPVFQALNSLYGDLTVDERYYCHGPSMTLEQIFAFWRQERALDEYYMNWHGEDMKSKGMSLNFACSWPQT